MTRIVIEASGAVEGRLTVKRIPLKPPRREAPIEVPAVGPSAEAAKTVGYMLKGGMIDRWQAERLFRRWHVLSEDDFSHPEMRVIKEHTRALLVSMATKERRERNRGSGS